MGYTSCQTTFKALDFRKLGIPGKCLNVIELKPSGEPFCQYEHFVNKKPKNNNNGKKPWKNRN